ncbi:MAG TPA: holo-ACP synthase [Anaerolineaceae bacterium]|jgi:holo-[acyl-carrier-protein] synthase|nr:holo-ACP synthase [Anaerolineaceae bacterium]HPS33042.1 holo-ACP synthase [Anaerolineaceae bacterium]
MIKCGVDIVKIERLDAITATIRARFIQRVFTPLEQAQLGTESEALAGVFAAKEAASKALGTGIGRVSWQDIEILHAGSGEPELRLHGEALRAALARGYSEWAVSITHDGGLALAFVVAQG